MALARPDPRPWEASTVENAATVRRLDCAEYGACLEQATIGRWRGFTCKACEAFAPSSAASKHHDLVPLLALAHHVVNNDPANDNQ